MKSAVYIIMDLRPNIISNDNLYKTNYNKCHNILLITFIILEAACDNVNSSRNV